MPAPDSSGKTLVFEHTVKSGKCFRGYDYIAILNNDLLLPSSTSITDKDGASAFTTMKPKKIISNNGASESLSPQELQTSAGEHRPKITAVDIVSKAKNGYYKLGDKIRVQITFDRRILFKARDASMNMYIDTSRGREKEVQLKYYSFGRSDKQLYFEYVIRSDKNEKLYDMDGIRIKADKIELHAGSIIDVENNSEAELKHKGVNKGIHMDKHKVDAIKPVFKSVRFSATSRDVNATSKDDLSFIRGLPISLSSPYKEGDRFIIKAIFSEKVKMHQDKKNNSICNGLPYLNLKIGSKIGKACVRDNKGKFDEQHLFTYKVQDGDNDAKGVVLKAHSFFSSFSKSKYIRDKAGNSVRREWYSAEGYDTIINHSKLRRVDTTPPKMEQVTCKKDKQYETGDKIDIKVRFTEPVLIKTSNNQYVKKIEPYMVKLILGIGGDSVDFSFYKTSVTISGRQYKNKATTGGRLIFQTITFRHKVTKDSPNGKIVIPSKDILRLSGVTIVDTAGNPFVTSQANSNQCIGNIVK